MDDAQRSEGRPRESDLPTAPSVNPPEYRLLGGDGAPPTQSPFRTPVDVDLDDPAGARPGSSEQGPVYPGGSQVDRKGRRRRLRQTATFFFFFLLILAVGIGAFMAYQGRISLPISEGRPSPLPTCPAPPAPTAQAFGDTNVNVYNASDRRGLALQIARELQKRGFKVPSAPANDPLKSKPTTTAIIRHGPQGELAARTVAGVVDGTVSMVVDDRAGETVDLVLGPNFKLKAPVKATASAVASAAPSPSATCQVAVASPTG